MNVRHSMQLFELSFNLSALDDNLRLNQEKNDITQGISHFVRYLPTPKVIIFTELIHKREKGPKTKVEARKKEKKENYWNQNCRK